ncbi:lysoplasmalogenase family protein [Streptomyces sp. 891-h]|uniref:lysoplasmalogenase family protein n=1 Tax=Streptomyces sp. 891-h TaxID=2720714 RepID=UPI001FA9D708|nr:lysoplasmalogenase family protein [Streptomyces sp. 891-h]UNZ18966.1 lysoplasmalogenase [Streptomyces sp. 891-h]
MALTKGRSLATFAALAAADLYATAKAPRGPARAAKPFLMPALAAHARHLSAHPRRPAHPPHPAQPGHPPAALLAGLACATAGDTALLWDRHHRALLTGMAAFLGTQVSYTAGMTAQLGAVRGLRARPKRAAAALAAWGVVNAALAPTLERRLRLPVAGYSLALTAMGAAALGVGGRVAAGALAFIASDALIGLQAAGHEFPSQEVLIMAGYLLGQYLITTGWLERAPAGAPAGVPD